MQKAEVDKVRARVQWFYGDRGGVSGSSAQSFAGKGRGQQSDKRAYKRMPKVVNGSVVPAEVTQVHATETRRQGVSRIPVSSGRSGGNIRRAISSLSPLQQQWIHYCYNPSPQRKREALKRLGVGLWEEYKAQENLEGEHQRTRVIASAMLRLQLEQARSFPSLCRWRDRLPVELEGSVSQSEWDEKFAGFWSRMHGLIVALDREALAAIGSA